MDHTYEKHERCDVLHCVVCDGGLSICTTCGLVEGSLTSECPGVQSYSEKADDVYAGKIDFKSGRWVNEPSDHSPAGWRNYRA